MHELCGAEHYRGTCKQTIRVLWAERVHSGPPAASPKVLLLLLLLLLG